MDTSALPLTGAIIIDLSDECLSLTGRFLADFGAEVIRVEAAGGDALRIAGPHLADRLDPESGLRHLLHNAGKRSVALNFDAPGAWDLVDRLLARADIVIAPLQKSAEARRALAADRLLRVHPHLGLIDAVMKRGGEQLPASDLVAVAAGGIMQGLGYPDAAPDYPAGRLAYKQASLVGAATATAMLHAARHGAPASHVCVSLQEAILSTTIHFANQNMWRLLGEKPHRPGGEISTLLQAQDGRWLTLGITPNTPARFEAYAQWLHERAGYEGLIGAEFPGDVWAPTYGSATHHALIQACASLPTDELCAEAQARGFLAVPVNTVADIVADPHLRARGCFVSVEHEQLGRSLELPRLPIRSTAFEPVARPAPPLGAHSAAVLAELAGVDAGEFARLRASGIVAGPDAAPGAPSPRQAPSAPARPHSDGPTKRDELPLAGVRVLDFCWQAAGPLTTELMANLGADVIKVESDARIDTLRTAVQPVDPPTIETGVFFQDCNTDKRSITLNLGSPDGIRVAKELVRLADVVTDNFTAGVMRRLGLGFDDLKLVNPRIVVASFPVMGTWGPKASWRGIGNSVVAMSGLAAHSGAPQNKPTGVLLHTDFTLAPLAVTAIVAALLQRERTGLGQEVEIPQYEAGIQLLDTELIEQLANGVTPQRRANRSPELAPHGLFPCAGDDRWVAIAVRNTVDWLELCRVIDRPDLAAREDLRTLPGRKAAEDEIEAAVAKWTSRCDMWEAADRLQQAGIPAGPAEDIEDLVETDPALQGFFLEFDHPAGVNFMAQNQPFLWNGHRLPIRRAPFFGEHNDEVFREELQLDEAELTRLIVNGVIR